MSKLNFIKVSTRLPQSSIMDEELHVFKVWIVLLTLADWDGYIDGTESYLARVCGVGVEQMNHAMEVLTAPDPNSTTKLHEGRRIIKEDGNRWFIVNFVKYRTAPHEEIIKQNARKSKQMSRVASAGGEWNEEEWYRLDCEKHRLPLPSRYVQDNDLDVSDCQQTSTHKDKDKDNTTTTSVVNDNEEYITVNTVCSNTEVKGERFREPTEKEVVDYMLEKGVLPMVAAKEAEKFMAYNNMRSWKMKNGKVMSRWKGAVSTWILKFSPSQFNMATQSKMRAKAEYCKEKAKQ